MIAGSLAAMMVMNQHPAQLHIVLTAGNPPYFHSQYQRIINWAEELFELKIPLSKALHLHTPLTAASFGSVNRTVLNYIRTLAQLEGVITDPIYTAKLFMTAEDQIIKQDLKGNILVIHSGGGMGLMGFGEKLS